MTIRYKHWTLALLGSLLTVPALADNSEGAYVYVSAGQGYARNACVSTMLPPGQTCAEKSVLFRAGYGYQFSSMWGLEASYGQFGYASSDGFATFPAPVGAGNYSWQLRANGLAVQGVATLHMGDVLSVFGKFGLARVEYDEFLGVAPTATSPSGVTYPTVHSNRNAPALGAGVQLDVTPHGSLRFMVESFGSHPIYNVYGSTTRVRLITASMALMYRY